MDLNRYFYSVVRCVPDPQTGEFVNIGAIAGDPATGDWSVRGLANESRVRKFAGAACLDAAKSFITAIGVHIDDVRAQLEDDPDATPLDAGWLEALHHDHRNVVQLTAPAPVAAEDAEDALDVLFARQIIDPLSLPNQRFVTKWRVTHDVLEAYRRSSIGGELLETKSELHVGDHVRTGLDFAVIAERTVQVAQAWSFQRAGVDEVAQQVKSWAFAVSLLRKEEEARVITAAGLVRDIPPNVEIEVAVAPPQTGEQRRTYDEAAQVFGTLGAHVRELGDVTVIGERAAELVSLG